MTIDHKLAPLILCAHPSSEKLVGSVSVGGDKSISHRAVIIASLTAGRSTIQGLSKSDDVAATIKIMQQLGVSIALQQDVCVIDGLGLGGLRDPDDVLDCGNSGTTARLMLGVLASHKLSACITGDESLRRRPMHHVIEPLQQMGANFVGSQTQLPLLLEASPLMQLTPISFEMQTPSAQLKSALILAGLNIAGESTIIERNATRDHTERLLASFGAALDVEPLEGGGSKIIVKGQYELRCNDIHVPCDPSSAAFITALAAISQDADLTLENVSVNPHRIRFYQTLQKMGAAIEFEEVAGHNRINEDVAHIKVMGGRSLSGVDIPASSAVAMIDEYPILSVVAACAHGTTHMRGLSQLRIKESDRLATIAENLEVNGVHTEIRGDDLSITGCGGRPLGGGLVKTYHDHRIAMAFLVLGAVAEQAVTIDDGQMIATSFPNFEDKMRALGVRIEVK